MYHEDDIVLLSDGLIIPESLLKTIGIKEESVCWGIWVPSISESIKEKLSHLLLSPFHPDSWPNLFRIVLKLEDEPGAVNRAASILESRNINLLSYYCSPTGHRHATWNIIGEALDLKSDSQTFLQNFPDPKDRFTDDFYELITKNLSVPRFEKSITLTQSINEAHEKDPFLYQRFAQKKSTLYREAFIPDNIKHEVNAQLVNAVRCSWLQKLAAFFVFAADKTPIRFVYNARNSQLKTVDDSAIAYKNRLKKEKVYNKLPLRVIGSFEQYELFARIAISPSDLKNRGKIRIITNYDANFFSSPNRTINPSSKGLLKRITKELYNEEVNLRFISNATTRFTRKNERGKIVFIGTHAKKSAFKKEDISRITTILKNIKHGYVKLKKKQVSVNFVGAKKIFISTKIDWFTNQRKDLQKVVAREAEKLGFDVHTGDISNPIKQDLDSNISPLNIQYDVITKIKASDAFLQIIPYEFISESREGDQRSWVDYELGMARALNLPTVICLGSIKNKVNRPKINEGWYLHYFRDDGGDHLITPVIKKALEYLAGQVYGDSK